MDRLERELYALLALGRERGLHEAVRWVAARMAEAERRACRGRRKVKVRLARGGGEFWVGEDLLR